MILSNIKEDTEKQININGNNIKHSKVIKILGTNFSEKLNWNYHIKEGKDSLIGNLKQRLNSLKMIAKRVSKKFARQLANALIMSKIFYNIETWGATSKENRKKIDKIILEAAKTVTEKDTSGRTNKWILKELKWMNIEELDD